MKTPSLKILLLSFILPVLLACKTTTETPLPQMKYQFSGTVLKSKNVTLGRGAAAGKFPVQHLTVLVKQVTQGDLKPQQTVLLEVAQNQCRTQQTCLFSATSKHPAYAGSLVLLLQGKAQAK